MDKAWIVHEEFIKTELSKTNIPQKKELKNPLQKYKLALDFYKFIAL